MGRFSRGLGWLGLLALLGLLAWLVLGGGSAGLLEIFAAPTNTPMPPTATPSATITALPSATSSPSSTPSPSNTLSPTATPLPTATPSPSVTPSPTSTLSPAPAAVLPDEVLLPLPTFEYQHLNNCGPCTTMMVMSMLGIETSQERVAAAMRPNTGDKNVEAEEIVTYLNRIGLQSRVLVGGDTARLRQLLAAGVPVIVEQLLHDGDDISHFRLVRGYSQADQLFITGDSYYGNPYKIGYDTFEHWWRTFNHRYVPVWKPAQTATVRAILGDDWDPTIMYTHARTQAQAGVDAQPDDAAWWLALGHSEFGLGQWDAAFADYQKAVALGGVTRRVLWYQWWPVTALNRSGRYAEVLPLADSAIATAGVYAEMRYERAVALHGLGRDDEARAELLRALDDDPNDAPARQLLAQLSS